MKDFAHYYTYLSPLERQAYDSAMLSPGNRTHRNLETNLQGGNLYDSFADFIDRTLIWSDTPQGQEYWQDLPNKNRRRAPFDAKLRRWSASGEVIHAEDLSLIVGELTYKDDIKDTERIYLYQEDIDTGLFERRSSYGMVFKSYVLASDCINIVYRYPTLQGGIQTERRYKFEYTTAFPDYWIAIPEGAEEYKQGSINFWASLESMHRAGYILIGETPTKVADLKGKQMIELYDTSGGSAFRLIDSKRARLLTALPDEYNIIANGTTIRSAIHTKDFENGLYPSSFQYNYEGEIIKNAIAVDCGNFGVHFFDENLLDGASRIELDNTWRYVHLVYFNGSVYLNDEIANDNGIYFCGECDEWYDGDEDHDHSYEDEDSSNDNPRFSYHSCEHFDYSEGSQYKVGFEIEKECHNGCTHNHAEIRGKFGWVKERDGSLDDDKGYELVSPTYDLMSDKIIEDATLIEERFPMLINGDTSSNCGGHIHLSKADTFGSDLLESLCGYLPALYSIYEHRINKSYCRAMEKEQMKKSDEKYQAVKVSRGRIEFRIFPAVKNLQVMKWRLDLIRLMVKNPTSNPLEVFKMLGNSRSELHKHFAKVFSRGAIYRKAKKMLDYAKQFDSNYYNVDMRADVRAINNKITRLNKSDAKKAEAKALELASAC